MNLCRGKEKKEESLSKMASKFPDIKKRENIRQNEVLYVTTTNDKNIPLNFGDRFIPRRYAFSNTNTVRNTSHNKTKTEENDVTQTRLQAGYWRKFNYGVYMSSLFDVDSSPVFQFSDACFDPDISMKFKVNPPRRRIKHINNNNEELDWQCKPRAKPSAFIDSTHDLPGFRLHSSKKNIDWSHKGQIGASFGHDLVIWTCDTDKTVVYHTKIVTALRFSPEGETLALGTEKLEKPFIQIWSMKRNKYMSNVLCLADSFLLSQQKQQVLCIEWHPNSTHILCGMNTGKIYAVETKTSETTVLRNHTSKIHGIKFNANAKCMATSDHDGLVIIIKWPSLKIQAKIPNTTNTLSKALLDWHPWNPVDIAIAITNSISIVNVRTKEVVAHYYRRDDNCTIDAIAFNKISAELAVSCCIKNPDGCVSFEILVMASLNRIVDVLKCHEDHVKFLLFSPDGKQLATAGNDDMLSIFNFFTQPNSVINRSRKKYSGSSTSGSNLLKESDMFKMQIR